MFMLWTYIFYKLSSVLQSLFRREIVMVDMDLISKVILPLYESHLDGNFIECLLYLINKFFKQQKVTLSYIFNYICFKCLCLLQYWIDNGNIHKTSLQHICQNDSKWNLTVVPKKWRRLECVKLPAANLLHNCSVRHA